MGRSGVVDKLTEWDAILIASGDTPWRSNLASRTNCVALDDLMAYERDEILISSTILPDDHLEASTKFLKGKVRQLQLLSVDSFDIGLDCFT